MNRYQYITFALIGYGHVLYADIIDTIPNYTQLPGTDNINSFEKRGGVTTIMSTIIEKALDITAMIAVIGVCIVGLMFITARGDPEKAKKAAKYLGVIALGIVIALTAYAVIAIIDKIPNTFRFF